MADMITTPTDHIIAGLEAELDRVTEKRDELRIQVVKTKWGNEQYGRLGDYVVKNRLWSKDKNKSHTDDIIAELTTVTEERDELKAFASKINEIRNSIVGLQTVNWSEHIYPLVAALEEAGIEGLPYPEAKQNFGTTLQQLTKLREVVRGAAISIRKYIEHPHFVIPRCVLQIFDKIATALEEVSQDPE